ncbi:MAG: DNA repair protein RadC [Cyclobacteriaceae bacterium]|jgi:DNA repair protein RadC
MEPFLVRVRVFLFFNYLSQIMEEQKTSYPICQWAEEDRPREKMQLKGRSVLSDAELIAILLGSGNRHMSAVDLAKMILRDNSNDLNELSKKSIEDLIKYDGMGPAKSISIISALELGRRRKSTEPVTKPRITCSDDIYNLFQSELLDLPHEEFWITLLKRNNDVISKERISIGGFSGTFADPKVIFKKALEKNASYIILLHNHPSGNKKPSQSDINLTNKLKQAGKTLDLPILDHLIFTDHGFFSFADEAIL